MEAIMHHTRNKPAKLDPATTDASIREQICEDISSSNVFSSRGKTPVDMKSAFAELGHAKFSELVQDSVTSTHPGAPYQFNNVYRRRKIGITNYFATTRYSPVFIFKKEYVFLCLLRQTATNEISLIQVSKAYNVLSGLHAYRFVFSEVHKFHYVMLAEGSAETYLRPNFNVELHYLELRKYHEPAIDILQDPVCRLSPGNIKYDQLHRLCMSIFASLHSKNGFEYESSAFPSRCLDQEIVFRTEEALEEVAGKTYSERMQRCSLRSPSERKTSTFYISRAYNPNQVFVYFVSPIDKMIYLNSLHTDVNIVRERYNFNKVET